MSTKPGEPWKQDFTRLSENTVNFPQLKYSNLMIIFDWFKASRIAAFSNSDHLPRERSPGAHGSASAGERAAEHGTYEFLKAEQNFSRLSTQDLMILSNPQRFGVGRNARRSWTIVRCLPSPSVWARSVASAVQSEYIRPLQVMWLIPAAAGY